MKKHGKHGKHKGGGGPQLDAEDLEEMMESMMGGLAGLGGLGALMGGMNPMSMMQEALGGDMDPETLAKMMREPHSVEDFLASLPPCTRARVSALQSLEERRIDIAKDYITDKSLLHLKREAELAKLHDKRKKLVENVPGFWLAVLLSHPLTGEVVTKEDEEVLRHLKDVRCESYPTYDQKLKMLMGEDPGEKRSGSGFVVTMEFGPNPFMENTVLEKVYEVSPQTDDGSGKETILSSTGTQIVWKRAQDADDSFFIFFDTVASPNATTHDGVTVHTHEMASLLDLDHMIGTAFRDSIIPYAVHLHTKAVDTNDADWETESEAAKTAKKPKKTKKSKKKKGKK